MRLFLKPRLFLNDDLFLAFLHVPLVLCLFLQGELFAECVCLSVLALLHESLKHLLVLQECSTRLKSKRSIKIAFVIFTKLQKLLHVGLLKSFQVSLAALNKLLFVLIPVTIEVTNVLLLLLKQLIHFDIVLCEDLAASLVVLLVP